MKKGFVFAVCFWVLILFSVFSIFNIIRLNPYNAEIRNSHSVLEDVSVNFSFKNKINLRSDFLVCFNDVCRNPETDLFFNSYYLKFNKEEFGRDFYSNKLSNIYFVFDEKNKQIIESNLSDIYLYVGNRMFNYKTSDIKKFDKKTIKVKKDGSEEENKLSAIVIPNEFSSNYKGRINHFVTSFLNLFYNPLMFIIPYFWLFIAFCIYAFKKDEINNSFKNSHRFFKLFYLIFGLIILFGVISRFSLLNYNPLWIDEIYTKYNAIENFKSCFSDPGNPPLFFVLEFFISKFNSSDFALRLLPCFLGIGLIFLVYLLFKNINKNLALFASFFVSINTIFIYHSKEIRSSILCACLIVYSIYILFEYLKNQKNKNFILFLISQILLINTHYYLAIVAFGNFVWGVIDLFDNKKLENKKQTIIKFTISNVLCALTFIPYLLISFKTASTGGFNSWIGEFDKYKFLYTINEFFINKYVFLFLAFIILINLILIYLPKNSDGEIKLFQKFHLKVNPELENLYIYLIYSFTFLLIVVSLISVFVKPIFHKRIFLSVYSLIVLIEIISISTVLEFKKLERFALVLKGLYSTVLFFICMLITHPMPLIEICTTNDYMNFILKDSEKYISQGYEIHGFLIDDFKILEKYPDVKKINIKWHVIKGNNSEYITSIKKEDYISPENKNQKTVLYLNSIGVDFKSALSLKPNAYIIYTNSIPNAKIIYD